MEINVPNCKEFIGQRNAQRQKVHNEAMKNLNNALINILRDEFDDTRVVNRIIVQGYGSNKIYLAAARELATRYAAEEWGKVEVSDARNGITFLFTHITENNQQNEEQSDVWNEPDSQ